MPVDSFAMVYLIGFSPCQPDNPATSDTASLRCKPPVRVRATIFVTGSPRSFSEHSFENTPPGSSGRPRIFQASYILNPDYQVCIDSGQLQASI